MKHVRHLTKGAIPALAGVTEPDVPTLTECFQLLFRTGDLRAFKICLDDLIASKKGN